MPRTKAAKKKVDKASDIKSLIFKEYELQCENEIKLLIAQRDAIIKQVKEQILYSLMEMKHPNRTVKEQREITQSTLMKTACDHLEGSRVKSASKSEAKKKKRSLSCAADDDGYLTGDSASSRGTRTSRARSRAVPLANSTTRVSRSLSRSRPQQLNILNTKKQGYATPTGKQPSNSYGMVTPKMKPNAPQLLLRRPKHGEVAISLEGSPLMVNPVANDNTANVNIPLGEGKLLSLQPGRGLRMSQVPMIDEETRRQLMTLKDHIQQICGDLRD